MSATFLTIMYLSKTSHTLNQVKFTYHYVSFEFSKIQSNKKDYDFQQSVIKINIIETM